MRSRRLTCRELGELHSASNFRQPLPSSLSRSRWWVSFQPRDHPAHENCLPFREEVTKRSVDVAVERRRGQEMKTVAGARGLDNKGHTIYTDGRTRRVISRLSARLKRKQTSGGESSGGRRQGTAPRQQISRSDRCCRRSPATCSAFKKRWVAVPPR